jgi:hypothetical protein
VRPGPHPIDSAAASLNPNKIVSQIIELLFDARLPRLANRHYADHGGDSNGDAQHGQYAAHFVPEQRHDSGTQQSRAIHESTPCAILVVQR